MGLTPLHIAEQTCPGESLADTLSGQTKERKKRPDREKKSSVSPLFGNVNKKMQATISHLSSWKVR